MNFKPTYNRILVDCDPVETRTVSGFFIPDAVADAVNRGCVLAVGPGRTAKNGKIIPIEIQLGERVLFAPGTGLPVRVEGVDYLVLDADDVLAIVDAD